MADDFGTPITPSEPFGVPDSSVAPAKKNNTTMIIVIVVIVLLCCCCLALGALGRFAWTYRDQLFYYSMNLLPAAALV